MPVLGGVIFTYSVAYTVVRHMCGINYLSHVTCTVHGDNNVFFHSELTKEGHRVSFFVII